MTGHTITITDAPPDYDGFGTRDVGPVGELGTTKRGPLRRVATPDRHVEWQRTRYSSGLHIACSPEKFAEIADLVVIG